MDSIRDIVICGPDGSGTSTQVNDAISYFQDHAKRVKDMRGTEIDALFHAERFKDINNSHISLKYFLNDPDVRTQLKSDFLFEAYELLSNLKIASMQDNDISTYIDPESADAWIFEEPAKRGAGQTNRTLELNRSHYGSSTDHISASMSHQTYRNDEYFRFRKHIRDSESIIVRSRCDE